MQENEEQWRRARLQRLKDAGVDPYPARSQRTHTIAQFLAAFDALTADKASATLVGRIRTLRKHGGLTFLHLEDGSGDVQVVMRKDVVGEQAYAFFHETFDMGDFLEAEGPTFVTKKGEKSLDATRYRMLTKTLLPMPEKWHGLSDVEVRYRQRYLDLLANPRSREIFKMRSTIVRTIRAFLDARGFIEVETPILQPIAGGASARPFVTHHEALDADMYLRIAPELYLKRCIVGGYERVYEVARCFRNEGIDHAHNPEFTQVEAYAAFMDYREQMAMIEEMLVEIIRAVGLDPAAVPFQGHVLNFSPPFARVSYRDALKEHAGVDLADLDTREAAAKAALALGVPVEKSAGRGTIIDAIYKHHVRPKIIQPTFLIDYPAELSPLAKRKAEDPTTVEMFQLVYGGGVENVKAFSELNDPLDQEERFKEQEAERARGDEEAQPADADFVTALKHGMPPTAGFGLGIDRLTATLTDSPNLKEVILFPTLRPAKTEEPGV